MNARTRRDDDRVRLSQGGESSARWHAQPVTDRQAGPHGHQFEFVPVRGQVLPVDAEDFTRDGQLENGHTLCCYDHNPMPV